MEKLHTFKSFSQLREEAVKMKQMKEVADRQSKSIESYSKLLKEYGVASPSELDAEVRNAFFARLAESVDVSLTINESTRAQIGIADKNGKITTVYLHYGSMGDNADVIRAWGEKEAKELVNLGKAGISFLGKKIGPKNDFTNPNYDITMFYGRDRGEKGNSTNTGKMDSIQDFARTVRNSAGAEYIYIYDQATKQWMYMDAYEDQGLKVFESNNVEEIDEAYDGNMSDFKYDLQLAIENEIGISPKAIKSVTRKGKKGFEVKMSSYMSSKESWETIAKALGAELVDFTPGSTNVGVFESSLYEARSINKIQGEWSKVTSEMAAKAQEWKAAEGDAKSKLLSELKDLTAKKKALETELEAAVAGKDKDLELAVSEAAITESILNEAKTVKDEAISRLADFFRVPKSNLTKFRFDGTDDVRALTAALNSTSYEGTDAYYKMAIELAKEELGVDEAIEINEEDIKTEEQFREYATEVLKKAHGEEYDEAKAKETIDGIVAKVDGDFGAAVGMLTSSLG